MTTAPMVFAPTAPTALAPMLLVDEEAELSTGPVATAADADEEDTACGRCGETESKPGNEIIYCDGCDASFHILCLPRPLACVPDGDWFCQACKPVVRFRAEHEATMELAVGSRLWACDPKHMWGEARVLKVEEASGDSGGETAVGGEQPEAPGEAGGGDDAAAAESGALAATAAAPAIARVRISYKGFPKKYDEWITIGVGRLRPLSEGPPHKDEDAFAEEFYVVSRVLDMRHRRVWE